MKNLIKNIMKILLVLFVWLIIVYNYSIERLETNLSGLARNELNNTIFVINNDGYTLKLNNIEYWFGSLSDKIKYLTSTKHRIKVNYSIYKNNINIGDTYYKFQIVRDSMRDNYGADDVNWDTNIELLYESFLEVYCKENYNNPNCGGGFKKKFVQYEDHKVKSGEFIADYSCRDYSDDYSVKWVYLTSDLKIEEGYKQIKIPIEILKD